MEPAILSPPVTLNPGTGSEKMSSNSEKTQFSSFCWAGSLTRPPLTPLLLASSVFMTLYLLKSYLRWSSFQ